MLKYFNNFICLVVCLVLLSAVASSQSKSEEQIDFPDVDGWERGDITTYPTAALGYSVGYQSLTGKGTVTVYVYNGGHNKISDGVEDKLVKSEIKNAGNDIKTYGELGYYDDVKKVKDETVTLGGVEGKNKALYSLFTFKTKGQKVESEIYLFGYNNNFIKIRATRPNSVKAKELEKLLLEIDKVLSGTTEKFVAYK